MLNKNSGGKRKIPKKYTRGLSKRDSIKQSKYIRTARKLYKRGKYVDRPKLKSYKKRKWMDSKIS